MKRLALTLLSATLALGLALPAAAKGDEARDAKRLELLNAHAGEPVKRVKFLRPMHGYEIAGPQTVLVWETPFKAWLVDVRDSPACRHLDREFKIGIDTLHDSLNSTNGYIVSDNGVRCKIEQLREVDVPAFKEAERTAGISK